MEHDGKDEFLDELENIRGEFLKGRPFRERTAARTKEAIAEGKRKRHRGGDSNHRFEGERYLNCSEKSVRRMQLRKLIDEGGQTTVNGKMPSHPELARWESCEFGLTPEEVLRLEKEDPLPQRLIVDGWWVNLMRTSHWAWQGSLAGTGRGLQIAGTIDTRLPLCSGSNGSGPARWGRIEARSACSGCGEEQGSTS